MPKHLNNKKNDMVSYLKKYNDMCIPRSKKLAYYNYEEKHISFWGTCNYASCVSIIRVSLLPTKQWIKWRDFVIFLIDIYDAMKYIHGLLIIMYGVESFLNRHLTYDNIYFHVLLFIMYDFEFRCSNIFIMAEDTFKEILTPSWIICVIGNLDSDGSRYLNLKKHTHFSC